MTTHDDSDEKVVQSPISCQMTAPSICPNAGAGVQGEVGEGARDQQGVGGEDDHPRRVLEQVGRQRGRAELLGEHQGNCCKVQTLVNHTQCQNVAISAINLLACDGQRLVSV